MIMETQTRAESGKGTSYAAPRYEAPQGEIEEVLAGIWSEVLKVDRVGRRDNFFELSGQSLQAMSVLEKVTERLGVQMPLVTIFQHPTICQLAQLTQAMLSENSVPSPADGTDLQQGGT
jgi:Phosphopantetheine attachment site